MTAQQGGKAEQIQQSPNQPPDARMEFLGQMVAVERERIASRDRETEVMRQGFAQQDAAAERNHQLQADHLHRNDEFRNRLLTHRIHRTWAGLGLAVVLTGVILSMMFWGDEGQQGTATTLMTHLLSAGGFFAVGYLLGRRSGT